MAYLEDLGCLGTALVKLLGGEVDFKVMDGFERRVDLDTCELEGFRGAGVLRHPVDSNRSFPVMSTLKKFLAAFEIFWHMLDFKSNISCLVVG